MTMPVLDSVHECPKCNSSFTNAVKEKLQSKIYAVRQYTQADTTMKSPGVEDITTEEECMLRMCSVCSFSWYEDIYRT